MTKPMRVVPGNPDKSILLYDNLATTTERMPPMNRGAGVKPEEIAVIRAWILDGAKP